MRGTSLFLALTALQALPTLAATIHARNSSQGCFPYGTAKLPTDLSAPNVPIDQWWCPQSMAYGFQGFSYPMEDSDCGASDNSLEQLNADFAQMSKDFGARVVRLYYPVCTDTALLQRVVQAAVTNNMAVIFQVWTNFGGGDVWQQSQQAIYDILDDPDYKAVVPYVVHMADFGSEPVGDGMDGGGDQFVTDLGKFRAQLNSHNILAGISEDWDRPGIMSNGDGGSDLGDGLGPVGQGVQQNSDYAHIHPMPYYHFNDPESEAWAYIQKETLWVKQYVGLPVTITESPWAWGSSDHNPGKTDVGVAQYTDYWKTFDDNCEWFKEQNVGWFLHAWRGEDTFDIVYDNGSYVISDWRPRKC